MIYVYHLEGKYFTIIFGK